MRTLNSGFIHQESVDRIDQMLGYTRQLGVVISPEDVARVGYKHLRKGYLDGAVAVIRVAQSLGAHIEPTVLAVIEKYQQLKPQQQTKA